MHGRDVVAEDAGETSPNKTCWPIGIVVSPRDLTSVSHGRDHPCVILSRRTLLCGDTRGSDAGRAPGLACPWSGQCDVAAKFQ